MNLTPIYNLTPTKRKLMESTNTDILIVKFSGSKVTKPAGLEGVGESPAKLRRYNFNGGVTDHPKSQD